MKAANDKYEGVKAITRAEAIALAPIIFGDPQWRQAHDLWRQARDLRRQVAAKYSGHSPDWRAVNMIAADLPTHVYCFVHCTTRKGRNEVWWYDDEHCPDALEIEAKGQVVWVEEEVP